MSEHVFKKTDSGLLEFIGDFEGLYKAHQDPWGQSGLYSDEMSKYYCYSRSQLSGVLQRYVRSVEKGAYVRGLEVGSGHGHVVDMLATCTGIDWDGMDISQTAVDQAAKNYPNSGFFTGDITTPFLFKRKYDAIVLGQILWYILQSLPTVFDNCRQGISEGGILVLSQAFLVGEQKYGTEVANGFWGTLEILTHVEGFRMVYCRYEDSLGLHHHDGIFVLRRASAERSNQA
jgi:SAM-dependent methyltransferase